MDSKNHLHSFDKRTQRIIKETAAQLNMDPEIAAAIIEDYERTCGKYIKMKWTFRIPALGIFYLSKNKLKKKNLDYVKQPVPIKKTKVLLKAQYDTYINQKEIDYFKHKSGIEQKSGGSDNSGINSSGS